MKEQLEKRLKELKEEFESGQKMLIELDARRANLSESLLRISGAIQVLQEEINKSNGSGSKPVRQSEPQVVESEKKR